MYRDVYKNATKKELIEALETALRGSLFPARNEKIIKEKLIILHLIRLHRGRDRKKFMKYYSRAKELGIISDEQYYR